VQQTSPALTTSRTPATNELFVADGYGNKRLAVKRLDQLAF
jgi:hypothetical protein